MPPSSLSGWPSHPVTDGPGPHGLRRPPTGPRKRRRTYLGLVVLALAALVVFGGTYGGVMLVTAIFQPAGTAGSPAQRVVVRPGETTVQVADELQRQGLIRNALVFRLLARNRGLDSQLQAGVHLISAGMTMDQIVIALEQRPRSNQVSVTIPEGLRVIEYPRYLTSLPNVNAQDFLRIAQTGQFTGRDRYWFVAPPAGARYALEGFLFPSTYNLSPQATATDVVATMLDGLGLALCPGPDQDPNRYMYDQQQCMAHARVVDPNTGLTIFAAMSQRHLTLAQALTLASLVQREARSPGAKAGVASVYYNRYLAAAGLQPGPDNGGPITMDADPTVQYAIGTPQDPWPVLTAAARTIDASDPYNSYTHVGLPPGPISGSGLDVLLDVVNAPRTGYFYFVTGADHQMHFAHTYAQQQQNIAQFGTG